MSTISVVISAHNEELKLPRTLKSLLGWASEIIVVDSGSTDKTADIARKEGAIVYQQQNNPMLNVNKNYGFTKASSDWILCLDADEEVPSDLAREIRQVIARKSDIVGYWISRKNIIFGKWIEHGLWWPDRQLRLFQRGKGKFACQHIHEYIEVLGKTGNLERPYLHYNYETISQFLRKMDQLYTENEVQHLIDTDYQLSWFDAIRFPVSDFVKIFFAQEGYKDGLHGFVVSMLQAFYSFIVFAKLWERKKFDARTITLKAFSQELRRSKNEIAYWILTSKINASKSRIERLWLKILRKFTME